MKRNRTFTGKFKVGQQVRSAHPGESGLGIGRIADVDPVSEMLAEIAAANINERTAPKREYKLCDCGHYSAWPMSTSSGSSCPDCYDRMSE